MARKSTGTVQKFGDCYRARITLNDGSRKWLDIPKEHATSEAKARKFALACANHARKTDIVSAPKFKRSQSRETFAQWSDRWFAWRRSRGIKTAAFGFSTHILPMIGDRYSDTIAKADIEAIVEHLDRKIAAGSLHWRTAQKHFQSVSKAFSDMSNGKNKALRTREDNPCFGVRGPDRGTDRERQFIYPSEFLGLVSCDRIPLFFRRMISVGAYTYIRLGELRGLQWSDVDLEHGVIHISRSVDPKGNVEPTKTSMNRWVVIEKELLPLLLAMREESNNEGAFVKRSLSGASARLQKSLEVASIDRKALHITNETSMRLRWHDLRATGITWRAVRGDNLSSIRDACGHVGIATTDRYLRRAQNLTHAFSGEIVFPELPSCLLGATVAISSKISSKLYSDVDSMHEKSSIVEKVTVEHKRLQSALSRTNPVDPSSLAYHLTIHDATSNPSKQHAVDDSKALHERLMLAIGEAVSLGELALAHRLLDALEPTRTHQDFATNTNPPTKRKRREKGSL